MELCPQIFSLCDVDFALYGLRKIMKREVTAAKIVGPFVRLYDQNGSFLRSVAASAPVRADVSQHGVAVTQANGFVRLHDSKGKYRRTVF